jgi:CRISPR type III-A-associated protein Csm2
VVARLEKAEVRLAAVRAVIVRRAARRTAKAVAETVEIAVVANAAASIAAGRRGRRKSSSKSYAVVSRMRDMDSGTKSQLRRLYSAVRRAVRAPESERQHEFVMLRARLAYTIARHGLRSLDQLEKLLLQVTRRNDARGYERFKDLFEAIVAYNE